MTTDDAAARTPDEDGPSGQDGPPELGMTWAIKRSFVGYILGMPDGQASAADGAWPLPDLSVVYAHDPSVPQDELGRGWAFRGDVRFAGHFGMLFVRIAFPWIVWTDDAVMLTIADPDGEDDAKRVAIATVELEETGPGEWTSTEVALTAAGSEIFNHVYPVGDPMDPFVLRVPAEGPVA